MLFNSTDLPYLRILSRSDHDSSLEEKKVAVSSVTKSLGDHQQRKDTVYYLKSQAECANMDKRNILMAGASTNDGSCRAPHHCLLLGALTTITIDQ